MWAVYGWKEGLELELELDETRYDFGARVLLEGEWGPLLVLRLSEAYTSSQFSGKGSFYRRSLLFLGM